MQLTDSAHSNPAITFNTLNFTICWEFHQPSYHHPQIRKGPSCGVSGSPRLPDLFRQHCTLPQLNPTRQTSKLKRSPNIVYTPHSTSTEPAIPTLDYLYTVPLLWNLLHSCPSRASPNSRQIEELTRMISRVTLLPW
jgi:hypothetical protein